MCKLVLLACLPCLALPRLAWPVHKNCLLCVCVVALEIDAELSSEKDELREAFYEHAVEGHVVKAELQMLCADLDRPLKNWELEAAWRVLDPEEHGWAVRIATSNL